MGQNGTNFSGKSRSFAQIIRLEKWSRFAVAVLVGLVIFVLGLEVGNGRISFGTIGTSGINSRLPNQLDYASVNDIYKVLKDNYDGKLSASELLDGAKEGLAQATGDPYTEYFTASQAKNFSDDLNDSLTGIGAQLGQDAGGHLEVIAPINGSPAAKAGLRSQDLITAINDQSTAGMPIETAVDKIRGPAGTKVHLSIIRNHAQALQFVIMRSDIQLPSVTAKILDGNIGYLQISTFGDNTSNLAIRAAQKFIRQDHVKAVILDLRDNGGGEVNAAVDVSSLWLPAGALIMQERGKEHQAYTATGDNPLKGLFTVVLVNRGTASASEITAGALHDNHAAAIYGTKTYGKGVVQEIFNLAGGAELKVTVASWYRPNGKNINHRGITPDKIVQLTDAQAQAGDDTQLQAAEAYLHQKINDGSTGN